MLPSDAYRFLFIMSFVLGFTGGFSIYWLCADFIPECKESIKAEKLQKQCDSLLEVNHELWMKNFELRDSLITLKFKEQ